MISPAIADARSHCVANGLPGAPGSGYTSNALSIKALDFTRASSTLINSSQIATHHTGPPRKYPRPDVVVCDELRRRASSKILPVARTMPADEIDGAEVALDDEVRWEVGEESVRALDYGCEGAVGDAIEGTDESADRRLTEAGHG